MQMSAPSAATPSIAGSIGRYRWVICALLFFASTINYVDRQVIGILKTTLQDEFGWSEIDYADIIFAFQMAYAIAFLFAGRMIDWLGTKKGYVVALVIWSIAAIAHAEAPVFGAAAASVLAVIGLSYSASVAGFIVARLALGFGEAGNFPAAVKVDGGVVPEEGTRVRDRPLQFGHQRRRAPDPAGRAVDHDQLGLVLGVCDHGALGFLWLFFWIPLYTLPENNPRVGAAELAHIKSDPPDPPTHIPWLKLLRYRQTWAFALGKFLTDPVWWLYLFWIPDFLNRNYGINLSTIGLPLVAIYLIADVGSIGGGWLSSAFIKRGWTRERRPQDGDAGLRARRVADGICVEGDRLVGGRRARRARGLRASGLVGESLHADL